MLKINTLIAISLFMILTSCSNSNLKVSSDYDKKSDFTVLKSYSWYAKRTSNKAVYEIMHERIIHSIDAHLKSNQFLLNKEASDFYVNYSVTAKDEVDINSHDTYSGYIDGWNWNNGLNYGYGLGLGYGYGYGLGYNYGVGINDMHFKENTEYTTTYYKSGTLIIDIIDAKTDKIIWRGIGKERLPENSNSKEMDKIVDQAVLKILKNFPPH